MRPKKVILFCGSAGSLDVLEHFLKEVPKNFNGAITVVIHRRKSDDDRYCGYLNKRLNIQIKSVEHGEKVEKGMTYLVPGGYHCLLEKGMTLSLDRSEKVHFCRPAADVSLESFSYHLGNKMIAIIVSGANHDGATGVQYVLKRGGKVIVQDPAEAEARSMPAAAIEAVDRVSDIVPASNIYSSLTKYM